MGLISRVSSRTYRNSQMTNSDPHLNHESDSELAEAHQIPTVAYKHSYYIFKDFDKHKKSILLDVDSTLTVNCPINMELIETFRIANAEWFGCPADSTPDYLKAAVPEARLSCDILLNFQSDKSQHKIYAISAVFMRRSPMLCGRIINARRKFNRNNSEGDCHFTVLNISVKDQKFNMNKLREGLGLVLYSLHGGKLVITNQNFNDIYLASALVGCTEITDSLSEISDNFEIDFEEMADICDCVLRSIEVTDGENCFNQKSDETEEPKADAIPNISKLNDSQKAELTK